jgi:hypothetical protein
MQEIAVAAALGIWMVASTSLTGLTRDPDETRIRPMDEPSRTLLQQGLLRSATVRALAREIEASDVLVFMLVSHEPGNWRGETRFLTAAAGARMLQVKINGALELRDRLAMVGHELQHVLEVARAPGVVDQAGMLRLFEKLGHQRGPLSGRYETRAAQSIERQVRSEVTKTR